MKRKLIKTLNSIKFKKEIYFTNEGFYQKKETKNYIIIKKRKEIIMNETLKKFIIDNKLDPFKAEEIGKKLIALDKEGYKLTDSTELIKKTYSFDQTITTEPKKDEFGFLTETITGENPEQPTKKPTADAKLDEFLKSEEQKIINPKLTEEKK